MKKKIFGFLCASVAALALGACDAKDAPAASKDVDTQSTQGGGETNPLAGTYDITVWVSETETAETSVKAVTEAQIDAFEAANPGIVINATVEGVSESDSATQMIQAVEDGADLYCFAQDQLSRLIQAGALNQLGVKASEEVTKNNLPGAVAAATVDEKIYCYPLTADNGYFMYYDKSVITDESHLNSLEDLIADCEAAGKLFSFQLETSGWYNASFFFGAGCHSNWTADSDGNVISVDDDFNSENGIIALKGMQKLLKSSCYTSSESGAADFAAATPSAIVVSGTWDSAKAKEILGDNMGCAKLPSFTVDDKTYQLGSFSGFKLMGVKPQADAKRAAVLQNLALYLTNEANQLERFEKFGWGPSNKNAAASDAVAEDIVLTALNAQSEFAVPQGNIHGSWWNIAKSYAAAAKVATTDADLQAALTSYENSINGLFSLDGMIIVGSWNNWDNADLTHKMAVADGVYTFTINVPKADYMGGRIVEAGKWDSDKGCTIVTTGTDLIDVAGGGSDNNLVFNNPGVYKVTYDSNANTIAIEVVNLVFAGANNGWSNDGTSGVATYAEGKYTVTITMESSDYMGGRFVTPGNWENTMGCTITAESDLVDLTAGGGDNNIIFKAAGTYTLVYDMTAGTITVSQAN